jgi:hypothetical protein
MLKSSSIGYANFRSGKRFDVLVNRQYLLYKLLRRIHTSKNALALLTSGWSQIPIRNADFGGGSRGAKQATIVEFRIAKSSL